MALIASSGCSSGPVSPSTISSAAMSPITRCCAMWASSSSSPMCASGVTSARGDQQDSGREAADAPARHAAGLRPPGPARGTRKRSRRRSPRPAEEVRRSRLRRALGPASWAAEATGRASRTLTVRPTSSSCASSSRSPLLLFLLRKGRALLLALLLLFLLLHVGAAWRGAAGHVGVEQVERCPHFPSACPECRRRGTNRCRSRRSLRRDRREIAKLHHGGIHEFEADDTGPA